MSNTFTDIIKAVRMGIQILVIAIGAYLILKGKLHQGMLFANMILAGWHAAADREDRRLLGLALTTTWSAPTGG